MNEVWCISMIGVASQQGMFDLSRSYIASHSSSELIKGQGFSQSCRQGFLWMGSMAHFYESFDVGYGPVYVSHLAVQLQRTVYLSLQSVLHSESTFTSVPQGMELLVTQL